MNRNFYQCRQAHKSMLVSNKINYLLTDVVTDTVPADSNVDITPPPAPSTSGLQKITRTVKRKLLDSSDDSSDTDDDDFMNDE